MLKQLNSVIIPPYFINLNYLFLETRDFLIAHWILLTASIVTLIYIVNSIVVNKLTKDSLVTVIANFLSAASVMGGISLVCHTVMRNKLLNDPVSIDESELAYTIIGGFAVAWIAVWELVKHFKDLHTPCERS